MGIRRLLLPSRTVIIPGFVSLGVRALIGMAAVIYHAISIGENRCCLTSKTP